MALTPEIDPRMATFLQKFIRDPKKGIDRSWRACQDKLLVALGPITKNLGYGRRDQGIRFLNFSGHFVRVSPETHNLFERR